MPLVSGARQHYAIEDGNIVAASCGQHERMPNGVLEAQAFP
jgi:hypothetical protein